MVEINIKQGSGSRSAWSQNERLQAEYTDSKTFIDIASNPVSRSDDQGKSLSRIKAKIKDGQSYNPNKD